ncbi:MAG: BatA domain-containing protein [Candidatus Riflebacteria bacterium]|nr:BatA domain-containing protein [Candidatus Riflebacteria bacterium]
MLGFEVPSALALLGLAPLVVVLYLMRSRPRRHVVSSNRIWREVLRRKREQSLLGRFRNSLFLFLHLLAVVLGALALAQPTLPGGLQGDTLLIVDTSASMGATDEAGTRLEAARRLVRELVGRLDPATAATLVEAGSRVLPLLPRSTDRGRLLEALDGLQVTDCAGPDAGELAAFLLAGAARPYARTYFVTDNCPSVSLADHPAVGRLSVRIVGKKAENVAITGLEVTELTGGKDAAVVVHNFGPLPARCRVSLGHDDTPVTAPVEVSLAAGSSQPVAFRGLKLGPGTLNARIVPTGSPDYLACDDSAWVVLGQKSRKVLLVERAGTPLTQVLGNPRLGLDVDRVSPTELSRAGRKLDPYDLIVSNGYFESEWSARNLLLFAPASPGSPAPGPALDRPKVSFTDQTHPAMRYLDFEDVTLERAALVTTPGRALASSAAGPLLVAREEPTFRQLVGGFTLGDTDLPFRIAFPILVANAVSWLTGVQGVAHAGVKVGEPVRLLARQAVAEVSDRDGTRQVAGTLEGTQLALEPFRRVGLARVKTDLATVPYAVNLFSIAESRIQPAQEYDTGEETGPGERGRRAVWREFLWAFLALLMVEWLLWHRLGG